MIDLLIAGAGPAGLATALYARRAGLTAVVVDPRPGPIDKPCGEGLMPGAAAALQELGVRLGGVPIAGIRYLAGDRSAATRFAAGAGRGVRRTELQAAMAEAAADAGVTVRRQAVSDIGQQPGSVTAAGVRARYLVAADGLHSRIRRYAGLERPAPGPRRWGLVTHVDIAPWTDLVEVYWGAGAEAYVTPVGPRCVGIAVLTTARTEPASMLRGFPELEGRLAGAGAGIGGGGGFVPGPVRGAGPLRQRVSGRTAGRVLLVGDAAGYVDALTGEGVGVALAGARALVQCVLRDAPQDYDRAWARASLRYRAITSLLLAAAKRPALRRVIVPAAGQFPGAFGRIVGTLAGTRPPAPAGDIVTADGGRPE